MGRWDDITPFMRFAEKIAYTGEGECWEWIGASTTAGYGVMYYKGRQDMAHRVIYKLMHGPIDGLVIDHLCRNPRCVNPAHLEAVPHRENCRRGLYGILRTHCLRGHEYTARNTALGSRGERRCRVCHRDAERAKRASRRHAEFAGTYSHVLLGEED